jgi:hypothetical protein
MTAPNLLNYNGTASNGVDETLTLAMTNMIPGIKDNVFNENTALGWFYSTGKDRKRGGASLSHGHQYAKSTAGGSYSRYGAMNVTPQDNKTRDQWPWKQKYWSVTIDGFTERVAGKGEWAIEDALEDKREEATNSMKDDLERDIFRASPADEDIRSLPNLVLASGTEGQINGTTNSWHQSAVVTGGSWAAALDGLSWSTCLTRSPSASPWECPKSLCRTKPQEAYEGTLVAQYRYTTNKADIGLPS